MIGPYVHEKSMERTPWENHFQGLKPGGHFSAFLLWSRRYGARCALVTALAECSKHSPTMGPELQIRQKSKGRLVEVFGVHGEEARPTLRHNWKVDFGLILAFSAAPNNGPPGSQTEALSQVTHIKGLQATQKSRRRLARAIFCEARPRQEMALFLHVP